MWHVSVVIIIETCGTSAHVYLQSNSILRKSCVHMNITHAQTQRCLHHLLCCWCVAQSHTIMSVHSCYEFFWGRSAAEFLCKFCCSLDSDKGVRATDEINMAISHFKSPTWNTHRLSALIELTRCYAVWWTHNRSPIWQAVAVIHLYASIKAKHGYFEHNLP